MLPILKIKSEEIENLKHRRNELARKTQIKSDEQTKVEALLNSEEKLKSIMGEKDHTITQQEKLINDLKKRFQEKNKAELNEKNALQEENNRLRENILELNEKISALDKLPLDRKKYDGDKIKKNDRESLKDKIVHREERRLKLVKKVKLEDIQKTVYEIRLRLI